MVGAGWVVHEGAAGTIGTGAAGVAVGATGCCGVDRSLRRTAVFGRTVVVAEISGLNR